MVLYCRDASVRERLYWENTFLKIKMIKMTSKYE